jgi:hypothetical protein
MRLMEGFLKGKVEKAVLFCGEKEPEMGTLQ